MEENITHALSLVGSVVLFIFALSFAIVSYEGLEDRTEFFFEVHNITARQGDATSQLVDDSLIERKVKFEEILLNVIDMPRYASIAGNNSNTKIKIVNSNPSIGTGTFSIVTEVDPVTSELNYFVAFSSDKYDVNNASDLKNLTEQVVFYALSINTTISSSNSTLSSTSLKQAIQDTTFSISYDEESITYTQNT